VGEIQVFAADRFLPADGLGKRRVNCFGGSAIGAISSRATCFRAALQATEFFRLTVFGVWMTMRSNVRIGVVVAMAAVIVLAITASSARSEISGRDAQALSKASLIYVSTVRKDGNQSKAAPVWVHDQR
jgi:hypothetical protein